MNIISVELEKGIPSLEKPYVNIKINEPQTIFVQLIQKLRLSSNNIVEVVFISLPARLRSGNKKKSKLFCISFFFEDVSDSKVS